MSVSCNIKNIQSSVDIEPDKTNIDQISSPINDEFKSFKVKDSKKKDLHSSCPLIAIQNIKVINKNNQNDDLIFNKKNIFNSVNSTNTINIFNIFNNFCKNIKEIIMPDNHQKIDFINEYNDESYQILDKIIKEIKLLKENENLNKINKCTKCTENKGVNTNIDKTNFISEFVKEVFLEKSNTNDNNDKLKELEDKIITLSSQNDKFQKEIQVLKDEIISLNKYINDNYKKTENNEILNINNILFNNNKKNNNFIEYSNLSNKKSLSPNYNYLTRNKVKTYIKYPENSTIIGKKIDYRKKFIIDSPSIRNKTRNFFIKDYKNKIDKNIYNISYSKRIY